MNYPGEGTNLHCLETKFSMRVHWKGNHACGCDDEPDRIELMPLHQSWPTLCFRMPEQRFELERVEAMMARAYDRGMSDRATAIRSTLRDLIGL